MRQQSQGIGNVYACVGVCLCTVNSHTQKTVNRHIRQSTNFTASVAEELEISYASPIHLPHPGMCNMCFSPSHC